ncbi:hypothetical protein TNCV_2492771 [Trichonephila clavipes]|uniref:Uncharacterized protein n=1 Tax=Trichonephila clavipes TaxID=2585209 RepID=A0A8X6RX95_TRICX|nr:hypothetical protein TNCV_2492771 [Trichonephila clavipes]
MPMKYGMSASSILFNRKIVISWFAPGVDWGERGIERHQVTVWGDGEQKLKNEIGRWSTELRGYSGYRSPVVKITDFWLVRHEFELSAVEDPPCSPIHVQYVEVQTFSR